MVISGNNLVVNGTTVEQADLINISSITGDIQTQLGLKAPLESPSFTGNVGIGTTSPNRKLNIVSNGTTSEIITSFGNASITEGLQVITNGNLDWGFNAQNSRNFVVQTNQTERMRIDSNGNVGIGVIPPSAYRLSVVGGGGIFLKDSTKTVTSGGNLMMYSSDSQAADIGTSIGFGGFYIGTTSDTEWAQIAGRKENNTSGNYSGYLQFSTRLSGGNVTERMRIDSAGNVGIGTSSPGAKLEVNGSQKFYDGTYTGWIGKASTYISGGATNDFAIRSGNNLILSTTSNKDIVLDPSGNVGIGTSSPVGKLDVNGKQIFRGGSDTRTCSIYNGANGAMYIGSEGSAGTTELLFMKYGGAEAMRITSSGNLLVGTTTDNGVDKLQVNGSVNANGNITANGAIVNKIITGNSGSWVSTGINVNAYNGGKTIMVYASMNSSAGNSTSSAVAIVRCGYDGDNYSFNIISSIYSGGGTLNFRITSSILEVTFGTGGNARYALYSN